VVEIRCFIIAEMQSSMSDLNMRSDFVSRSACDEKVPHELPIALLTEPLGDTGDQDCRQATKTADG
jgi:hypothetical protein